MAKFFSTPFGASASKTTIPNNDSSRVSWNTGYTVNYEYNPLTDKNAKHIERDVMNTLFYEITSTLRQLQLSGVAPYYEDIIRADGPGYATGTLVSYGGEVWRSKIDNNRVIPNANSAEKWEIVYGYDSLVARLIKDGIGGGGGGGSGSGDSYSRAEIDKKLSQLSETVNQSLNDYYYTEPGEIMMLSDCGIDRNEQGFFICNGDYIPFDPTGEETDSLYYHGNQLYDLCYEDDSEEGTKTPSAFKPRWNIDVNEKEGKIQLPDILGYVNATTYLSDDNTVLMSAGREAKVTDFTQPSLIEPLTDDTKKGSTYFFTLIPAIYLGNSKGET